MIPRPGPHLLTPNARPAHFPFTAAQLASPPSISVYFIPVRRSSHRLLGVCILLQKHQPRPSDHPSDTSLLSHWKDLARPLSGEDSDPDSSCDTGSVNNLFLLRQSHLIVPKRSTFIVSGTRTSSPSLFQTSQSLASACRIKADNFQIEEVENSPILLLFDIEVYNLLGKPRIIESSTSIVSNSQASHGRYQTKPNLELNKRAIGPSSRPRSSSLINVNLTGTIYPAA